MLKVVLDTNTFISGTIQKRGNSFLILDLWRQKKFELITSPSIIDELIKVFYYPHVKQNYHISEAEISAIVLEVKTCSFVTSEKIKLKIIKDDPSDDKFIECAIEGKADYLVSGDQHLKVLKNYQNVKIVSPLEFLEIIK